MYCTNCGKEIEDSAVFCGFCGTKVEKTETDTNYYQRNCEDELSGENQNDNYQTDTRQNQAPFGYSQSVNSNVKKRKGKGKKIAIIAVVAVVVLLMLGVIGSIISGGYTKGELDGDIYRNKWADIELSIPDGFESGASEELEALEAGGFDVGLFLKSKDGRVMMIGFSNALGVSTEKFVESYIEGMTENLSGISYNREEDGALNIAEKEYAESVVSVKHEIYDAEFSIDSYLRKIGNRFIIIMVTGLNNEENERFVQAVVKKYSGEDSEPEKVSMEDIGAVHKMIFTSSEDNFEEISYKIELEYEGFTVTKMTQSISVNLEDCPDYLRKYTQTTIEENLNDIEKECDEYDFVEFEDKSSYDELLYVMTIDGLEDAEKVRDVSKSDLLGVNLTEDDEFVSIFASRQNLISEGWTVDE